MTNFLSTTAATLSESTTDDDEHDDDPVIPHDERKDEINDSEKKIFASKSHSKREAMKKCLFL